MRKKWLDSDLLLLGLMFERAITTPELIRQCPTVQSTLKETRETFRKVFGLDLNLDQYGKVLFLSQSTYVGEYRRNLAQTSAMASLLEERALPADIVFNPPDFAYAAKTPKGTVFYLRADFFAPLVFLSPNYVENREAISKALILIFRASTTLALDQAPNPVVIPADDRLTSSIWNEFVKGWTTKAHGREREDELLEVIQKLKRQFADERQLIITGRGLLLDIEGSHGNYVSALAFYQGKLLSAFTKIAEAKFIERMKRKHPWFISPPGLSAWPSPH